MQDKIIRFPLPKQPVKDLDKWIQKAMSEIELFGFGGQIMSLFSIVYLLNFACFA